jgi:AraC family transcriptional regulator
MDVQFVDRGPIKLAGYVMKTSSRNEENLKAIPQFWGEYMNDGRMEKLYGEDFLKNHAEYGVCYPEDADGNFDYVIGVELKDGAAVTPDYHACEIPASSYAVFATPPADIKDFINAIQQTWRDIFGKWLPQSGQKINEAGLSFELYDGDSMGDTPKVCKIWIPLIKK